MRYLIVIPLILTIIFLTDSKPHTSPSVAKQVVINDLGWAELVSGPVPIVTEGEMSGTLIGLNEIEFRMSDMTYTAIVSPHANGDLSPLPKTPWEKGDEVFIVSIPNNNGIQTMAYVAIHHRPKRL